MCIDTAIEPEQSEYYGKVPSAAARPTGISGMSPRHLAVGAQPPLPHSSSSEDIDNNSDDQVDMDVGLHYGGEG